MAGNTYYTNAATGNLYSTAGNWSGASEPVETWDAILEGARTNDDMTGELLAGATPPDSFQVASSYAGNIGSSGTSLQFDAGDNAAVALMQIEGSGQMYIKYVNTITELRVNIPPGALLQLGGAGTITKLYVTRGKVNITAGTVTDLWTAWSTSPNDVTVDIEAGATVTNIRQNGGRITSASTTTHALWEMVGGSARSTGVPGAGAHITTLRLMGGRFQWDMSGATTEAITSLFVHNRGIFDMSRSGDNRTLTASTVFSGGTIDARTGVPTSLTFTANPIVIGSGAAFLQTGSQGVTVIGGSSGGKGGGGSFGF